MKMLQILSKMFLGSSPTWYKFTIIVFLAMNPLLLLLLNTLGMNGPFIIGWILLLEFIFTLALALKCYPLQPGGLLAIQAIALGLTTTESVFHEISNNLEVILLLVFAAGKIVEKIINLVALKLVNKLLGAFFAIVKIGLVLAVLITIIESYDQKLEFIPKKVKSESLMYEPLLNVANTVLPEIEKNNLFKELKSTSLGETE